MNLIVQADFAILNFILEYIKNPILDKIMLLFTHMGNAGLIWIVTAIVFICTKKYRKDGIAVGIALLLGFIVCNIIMKNAFARMRPYNFNSAIELIIAEPTDFSFPSGHSCSSFAATVTMLMVSQKRIGIPAVIIAVLIAFSRLYLYVHYPSDVLAGALVGTLSAFASLKIVSHIPPLKKMQYSSTLRSSQ